MYFAENDKANTETQDKAYVEQTGLSVSRFEGRERERERRRKDLLLRLWPEEDLDLGRSVPVHVRHIRPSSPGRIHLQDIHIWRGAVALPASLFPARFQISSRRLLASGSCTTHIRGGPEVDRYWKKIMRTRRRRLFISRPDREFAPRRNQREDVIYRPFS